jgi:antitoxin (DNA-binding transcriptional repressor) of toxin-antitoxin stability system
MILVTKRTIHISEAEAASDFEALLALVRAGAEIIIEHDAEPVAVVHPAEPRVRLLSESLRLARKHGSTATLDVTFHSLPYRTPGLVHTLRASANGETPSSPPRLQWRDIRQRLIGA